MAPGVELSDVDWLAVVLAVVSNIVIGFIWYSPKSPTGRTWMAELKLPKDMKPDPKAMAQSMVLMVVGTFLLMFVLSHVYLAFRDAYRLDGSRLVDGVTTGDGLQGALWVWLGFFVPMHFGGVSWEGRSWKWFTVVAGYSIVSLLVAGLIFAWRL